MAEASEWTEELLAEYFELRGYAVIRDLPTTTGKRGGRSDADIIAFKWQDEDGRRELDVIDAEAGTSYESAGTISSRIEHKFTAKRRRIVLRTVELMSAQPRKRMNYRRFYFDFGWLSEAGVLLKLRKRLSPRVRVVGIEQLVNATAAGIETWKVANPTPKGSKPSLPERFPSLQVLLACKYCWAPSKIEAQPVEV